MIRLGSYVSQLRDVSHRNCIGDIFGTHWAMNCSVPAISIMFLTNVVDQFIHLRCEEGWSKKAQCADSAVNVL
jgi:hypothetical protein